jgi:hypothetical protein
VDCHACGAALAKAEKVKIRPASAKRANADRKRNLKLFQK